jgi:predicted AlkP superfamily phosphohydrolase/phosphomutase
MSAKSSKNRMLVIGLDGATLDLIGPWAAAGKLPNLQHLLETGVAGPLRSTIPTLSAPAWTSLFTGKNPGNHGAYDFVVRRPGSYEMMAVHNDLPRLGTVFRYLSEAGRRVAVINVPMTYPPEPVNGIMISGLGAPSHDRFAYPAELIPLLKSRGYAVNNEMSFQPARPENLVTYLRDVTQRRADVILELQHREDWDLFMVVFRDIDTVQTYFWHYLDETHPAHDPQASSVLRGAILAHHQQVDAVIGQLLTQAGDDVSVLVVSDHGAGPLYREVFLNYWLQGAGYLRLKRAPTEDGRVLAWFRRIGINRRSLVAKLGRPRVERWKRRMPWAERWLPWEYPTLAEQVDWQHTVAYSLGNMGQIYLNQTGREPEGVVSLAERETVLRRLESELGQLSDPENGAKMVGAVYRREDLYSGPFVELAPDISLNLCDLGYCSFGGHELLGKGVTGAPLDPETGIHRLEGIIVASGPHVATAGAIVGAQIVDVAPTILHHLGLPVPRDMDGRVLPLFSDTGPVGYTDGSSGAGQKDNMLTADEEEAIMGHLRDLGYVD